MNQLNDPEYYKRSCNSNSKNNNLEDIYATWDNLIPLDEWPFYEKMTEFLIQLNPQTPLALEKAFLKIRREFKFLPKKSQLKHVYTTLVANNKAPSNLKINQLLIKKAQKSQSGVLVITVLTSPYPTVNNKKQKFSCQWNCYYCPNEPGQPRSYLHDEPSVLRANRNDFDPILQFCDRAATLAMNGHPVDKVELLILGGTWSSYPHEYQERFIRDLFYAANTFYDRKKRDKYNLDTEKKENETAIVKIIGITLETRPDCINKEEIRRFRKYGCTRVQLGIQHTDDIILKKINRACTNQDAINALTLLRECCYKTDIHIMPNLPGSSPELDKKMFDYILDSSDLQADQWKIYPCEVTPWTVIKKWYDEGLYVPYSDKELMDLLIKVKEKVHPWIRLNRVIRDIPSQYILGGMDEPNLRQVILSNMKKLGKICRCIRCREIKDNKKDINNVEIVIRKYIANNGIEYFISYETLDKKYICGFVRLRISDNAGANIFPSLKNCALIRELHVYGQMVPTKNNNDKNNKINNNEPVQHTGFGTNLMKKAEEIALKHNKSKMAVISGVGVRNFYRKIGFELDDDSEMMIKDINKNSYKDNKIVKKIINISENYLYHPNINITIITTASLLVLSTCAYSFLKLLKNKI